jgi:cell division protein YceG involved in septum cleavage
VDDKFSSREDFAPGRYKSNESVAAQTMLGIMDKAMQGEFSKYIKEGKKVKIIITGSADGSPIKRPLPYSGEYGDYNNAPVNFKGETLALTVNKNTGIATNEQLAFMRSMGMKDSIKKKITVLEKLDCLFETQIEQAEEIGGKYRRIYVDYIFVDAF